jgi:diaminohydroxyphosphoribosylaminopyrimidine deaminase/5-amino-6-(5-phosphoribosylamino)uracil reductase
VQSTLQSITGREPLDETHAWALLRALAGARERYLLERGAHVALNARGALERVEARDAWVQLRDDLARGFVTRRPLLAAADALLALHMPLCFGALARDMVVAHLGQSLDGRVATARDSDNKFITGARDILHTHHLRALFDVVLVGARTIAVDDPQLTTRLCSGRSPVRVIVDTNATLAHSHKVFQDVTAPTLLATCEPERLSGHLPASVAVVPVSRSAGQLDLRELLDALRARGLRRIYVEGGGVTIARFLGEGLLDRLQLAVAPKLLGGSAPALALPAASEARLSFARHLPLGDDMLYEWVVDARRNLSAKAESAHA